MEPTTYQGDHDIFSACCPGSLRRLSAQLEAEPLRRIRRRNLEWARHVIHIHQPRLLTIASPRKRRTERKWRGAHRCWKVFFDDAGKEPCVGMTHQVMTSSVCKYKCFTESRCFPPLGMKASPHASPRLVFPFLMDLLVWIFEMLSVCM